MIWRMAWLVSSALLLGSAAAEAQDADLIEIRALLEPMRARPLDGTSARGATPALTDVKHKLRDWIEKRLHEFRDRDETRAFARALNVELRDAKLSCDARDREKACPERYQPGYLGDVNLIFGEALIVTTAVGITCGVDESAYAYSRVDGRWKRF